MKKFLSLFLALSLLLGVCGVAAAEDNTFSVAIVRWTDGWGVDFTQTAFLKEIGEATGVNIEWQPYYNSTWSDQKSLMLASGLEALPDAFFGSISLNDSDIALNEDYFVELTDYIAQYMPNRQAVEVLENSGNNEITLSSLSTSDYRGLKELTDELIPYCAENRVSLSVPSLRADNFSRELMEKLQTVRKSGLTFAPEAGTQRLRDVINKNLREEEILSTCAQAFAGGWNNVKLYFMLGLPTETDEDVLGIAELVYKVVQAWKENAVNRKRGLRVHVATAYFVPKPHTPFQWEAQITPQEYLRRCKLLKEHLYSKSIEYDYHSTELSRLEAVFARGDRRLGAVIEEAVNSGARLDGWDEYFRYDIWCDAFEKCGIPVDFYTVRGYGEEEILPWDMIDVGVSKKFLLRERQRAYEAQVTPDCRHGCAGCGANGLLKEVSCDA